MSRRRVTQTKARCKECKYDVTGKSSASYRDTLQEQWISRVVQYSSQYNNDSWSANCVVGQPRVYPQYGDLHGAWAQGTCDANQYIEVEFPEKWYLEELHIYETYNPGAVTKISAKKPDDQWGVVWQTDHPTHLTASRIFIPPIEATRFETNTLRLHVDCTACNTWCELDAILFKGRDSLHEPPPVLRELAEDLQQLVYSKQFADVTFVLDSGTIVHAHKAVLACRTDYFKAMFTDGLKESTRTSDKPISMKAVDDTSFHGLIHFIYTNTVDLKVTPVVHLGQLIRVGDRFALDALQRLATWTLFKEIDEENVVQVYLNATEHLPVLDDVKEACLDYIAKNMAVVSKKPDFTALCQPVMLEIVQQVTERMHISK